jgi:transmembrane sensor
MTNRPDPPDLQALREEAAAWLLRVQSEAATEADWRALGAWLASSERHRRAYVEIEELSAEISEGAETLKILLRPEPVRPRRWRARTMWRGLPIAAGLAIGGVLLWQALPGPSAHYATGIGQTREIALADGSRIHMNAQTTLDVRMGWRGRHVSLPAGEASFDVAKDPGRPFLVDVADERVRVVGTAFNIRHYDGLLVLTVSRGVVEAGPQAASGPPARLTAGQALTRRDGAAEAQVSSADPKAATAWTEGRLVCVDRPLRDIVADLNRHYPIPILLGPAAAETRFSGVIVMGEEAEVVRRLATFLNLPIRRTQGGYVLG